MTKLITLHTTSSCKLYIVSTWIPLWHFVWCLQSATPSHLEKETLLCFFRLQIVHQAAERHVYWNHSQFTLLCYASIKLQSVWFCTSRSKAIIASWRFVVSHPAASGGSPAFRQWRNEPWATGAAVQPRSQDNGIPQTTPRNCHPNCSVTL